MFFPERRERTLYVIQNGKLGPEYAAIDLKILPLALRAVQTMVKYQVIDNLLALALIAKSNQGRFFFNAIPPSFQAEPHSLFDRRYARELFEAGREVGRAGKWYASPPSSPTLLPMEAFEAISAMPHEVPRRFGHRGCMQSAAAAGFEGAAAKPDGPVAPK